MKSIIRPSAHYIVVCTALLMFMVISFLQSLGQAPGSVDPREQHLKDAREKILQLHDTIRDLRLRHLEYQLIVDEAMEVQTEISKLRSILEGRSQIEQDLLDRDNLIKQLRELEVEFEKLKTEINQLRGKLTSHPR